MNYSKEFFDWTKTEGEWSFTIKDVSGGMTPGNKRDIKCDGIGFNRMVKEMDTAVIRAIVAQRNQGTVHVPATRQIRGFTGRG